ncbi:MAG: PAS domain S-box protein [Gammaproteobacteria bacterium]|nr:PAS domain S-box protein [Gammaproteobacteria bacterium]MDH5729129.1 PAS domain S-box protein [Gammaproteobacteria bacterium]
MASRQPHKLRYDLDSLRALFEKSDDALILHDLTGRICDVNQSLIDNLGYTREALLQMSLYDIELTAQSIDRGEWRKIISENQVIHTQGVHKRKDGSTFPVSLTISAIHIDGADYIVGFARNLTQNYNAEKHAQFTQFAVDNAGDSAFWLEAEDARILYVNKKAYQSLGYAQKELLKLSVFDLCPFFSTQDWQLFIDYLLENEFLVYESQYQHKQGHSIPVEVTAKYMQYDQHGYVVHFVRDISKRKRNEKILKQAKREAEKANLAKTKFLTSMSHELKTPLNAIIGYSEMLLENDDVVLTPEQHHFARSVLNAGKHLLSLIEDVLDLARIESGQMELHIEAVSLNEIIEDSLRLVLPLAQRNHVSIHNHIKQAEQYWVEADFIKSKQVLINLLSNAIKYNRLEGEVNLKLQAMDGQLKVCVSDTGIGIPDEKQAELFTAFNRLGQEASNIEGSGVGLIVCKELVELMGGLMGFESIPEQGSCFWFSLPIKQSA